MLQERTPRTWILIILTLTTGCDERATQIAIQAADRQAQQNEVITELNREVAGGTRHLVDSDARARKEFVSLHRELQAERSRLDSAWTALEKERRQIAMQRRTDPILMPAISLIGSLLLVIVLLGFCWYALVASRHGDDDDAELSALLVSELLVEDVPLGSANNQPVALPRRSRPNNR
jgi:hypothetical protein